MSGSVYLFGFFMGPEFRDPMILGLLTCPKVNIRAEFRMLGEGVVPDSVGVTQAEVLAPRGFGLAGMGGGGFLTYLYGM